MGYRSPSPIIHHPSPITYTYYLLPITHYLLRITFTLNKKRYMAEALNINKSLIC